MDHAADFKLNNDKSASFLINVQVSYLVVISPSGETVFSGVFGDKEGNNAGM